MKSAALINYLLALILAPLLPGVIDRVKAWFAGRTGRPLFQRYRDLRKLFAKGAVYSLTSGWVFGLGPVVGLSAALLALAILPFGGAEALLAFPGDFAVLIYLLGAMRFSTILSALDTGSSFEGMGASREALFSALAEPSFLLCLLACTRLTGSTSLSVALARLSPQAWAVGAPVLVLAAAALAILVLTENSRMPVDDPNTHLELTMIHEVMVLDHSGPDLGLIFYAAQLKLWITGSLLVTILLPVRGLDPVAAAGLTCAGMLLLAVGIGVVESVSARWKLLRVPHYLMVAGVLALLSLIMAAEGPT